MGSQLNLFTFFFYFTFVSRKAQWKYAPKLHDTFSDDRITGSMSQLNLLVCVSI